MINATRAEIDEFIKKNAVYGNYLEANPDFFGFSDMKGFYEKASELYTGFTYDNFKDFIPKQYAEYDGKLCIYAAFGEKGNGDERYYQAKYLLFYDDQNNNDICALPPFPPALTKTMRSHMPCARTNLKIPITDFAARYRLRLQDTDFMKISRTPQADN